MLLDEPGQRVLTAASGVDALRRCLHAEFAVVVLDVRMPDMDGYETAASIHARPRSAGTPIIFLTGSDAGDIERLRGYDAGAVDFLQKPANPMILRSKVRVFVELWRKRQEILVTQRRLRELEAREVWRQAEEAAAAERRRADAAVRQLRDWQTLVFQSAPVALFARGRDDPRNVTQVSENVERVLGYGGEAFSKDPGLWRARLHTEDRGGALAALANVTPGAATGFTYRWRLPDGSWRWILEHVAWAGDGGQGQELLGTWVDIHEQKQMEEALRHANEALDRQVGERTAELAAAVEELESFSYSVSHDLRAPLRSIHGYSRILAESYGPLSPEGRKAQERLEAAVTRMGQLIDDLLRLSQVARTRLDRERVDLSELTNEVVGVLRERHPDRDVDVVVQPGLVADVDPRLIRIVLENLLDNAWKFTAPVEHARVEIGAAPGDPRRMFVRDNGVGFDMRYSQQLFRPFQRLQTQFEGTGIGLATVRRIIQRHGGEVWSESAPGVGSTFCFTTSPNPGGNGFRP